MRAFSVRRSSVVRCSDTSSSAVVEAGEAVEHVAVDERRDVLVRLEVPVVGQLDQVAATPERRVAAEEQGDVDRAVPQRLAGDGSAGVEPDELLEAQAVGPAETGEAERSRRALGRAAEA